MFQIGLAVEAQARGGVVTVSVGWGLAMFADQPWWRNLFAVVWQGAPGVRRYGLVVLGFFATVQGVDIAGAQKALVGAQIQSSSVHGEKNSRRAA